MLDFGLPKPTAEELSKVQIVTNTDPVLVREEKDYNLPELLASVETVVPMFTVLKMYSTVVSVSSVLEMYFLLYKCPQY